MELETFSIKTLNLKELKCDFSLTSSGVQFNV